MWNLPDKIIIIIILSTYIATVPQRIRPGSTADIGVTSLQNGVNRVRIIVTLMDKDNKTIARTQADRNLLRKYQTRKNSRCKLRTT